MLYFVALNSKTIKNNRSKSVWRASIVASSKLLPRNLPGATEEITYVERSWSPGRCSQVCYLLDDAISVLALRLAGYAINVLKAIFTQLAQLIKFC
jgi:hypothetical protein